MKFKSLGQGMDSETHSSSNSSPAGKLASITKHLLSASLSNGSTAAYKRSWNLFTESAQSTLGETKLVLPIQPAVIALFVSHLYPLHYASSTVTSYLSAIGYTHKLAGVGDPTEKGIIRQIIKGYRNLVPAHMCVYQLHCRYCSKL